VTCRGLSRSAVVRTSGGFWIDFVVVLCFSWLVMWCGSIFDLFW